MKSILKGILRTLYYLQLTLFFTILIAIILIISNPDKFVIGFAHFLVIEKSIHKADVIVITSGEEDDKRIAEGISLYEKGYSDFIIFSGYDMNAKTIEEAVTTAGISQDHYLIDDQATSTIENATCQEEFVKDNNIQSMLVIFSPPQSRRGLLAFKHTFPNLSIYVSYSDDSSYTPDNFYESKVTREMFNDEAPKTLYYYIKYFI